MVSSVLAPARSVYYTVTEIAAFCDLTTATVRKWFAGAPKGVFRFPRGTQQPTLKIQESVVREKLAEVGFSADQIDGFIQRHDLGATERQQRIKAAKEQRRQAKALTPPRAKRKPAQRENRRARARRKKA